MPFRIKKYLSLRYVAYFDKDGMNYLLSKAATLMSIQTAAAFTI